MGGLASRPQCRSSPIIDSPTRCDKLTSREVRLLASTASARTSSVDEIRSLIRLRRITRADDTGSPRAGAGGSSCLYSTCTLIGEPRDYCARTLLFVRVLLVVCCLKRRLRRGAHSSTSSSALIISVPPRSTMYLCPRASLPSHFVFDTERE